MKNRKKIQRTLTRSRARRGDYYVEDPAQLAALASTTRQDIVDAVVGLGRCTMRELAEALGRPADGLYYHVRRLCKVGLLHEETSSSRGAAETVLRGPTDSVVRLVYDPPTPKRQAALRRIVGALLRSAQRDFAAALGGADVRSQGPRRNLNASRQRVWLTPPELEAVNRVLLRLQDQLARGRRRPGAELVTFSFIMAPGRAKPARRAAES